MKKRLLTSFLLALFCSVHAQVIVTAAGNGTVGYSGDGFAAIHAELAEPVGVALDDSGNLYICDRLNGCIRKVSPAYGGIITTIAGNGTLGYSGDGGWGFLARLNAVSDVAVDHYGNVYIADGNDCIRKVTPSDTITTVAGMAAPGYNGDGIPATAAMLSGSFGVAVDDTGNIYIADAANFRIRKVDTTGIITTIAGTGVAGYSPDGSRSDTSRLYMVFSIRIDSAHNLFFTDNYRVRKIDAAGIITTIAGNGTTPFSGDSGPATLAGMEPVAIALDTAGNLFIADGDGLRIRKVNTSGIINTVAGDGAGGPIHDGGSPLLAGMGPMGVAVSNNGDIYIGDAANGRVRLVTTRALQSPEFHNSWKGIGVWPNPCSNSCVVKLISMFNESAQLSITDITGIEVCKFDGYTNQPIAIKRDWPKGMYIISATTEHEKFRQNIIVE